MASTADEGKLRARYERKLGAHHWSVDGAIARTHSGNDCDCDCENEVACVEWFVSQDRGQGCSLDNVITHRALYIF